EPRSTRERTVARVERDRKEVKEFRVLGKSRPKIWVAMVVVERRSGGKRVKGLEFS
ncbi:hypothetical protein A2U01_0088505, partial [Trifolium medium]|nr:hypothetical protein [Trifolium medium]